MPPARPEQAGKVESLARTAKYLLVEQCGQRTGHQWMSRRNDVTKLKTARDVCARLRRGCGVLVRSDYDPFLGVDERMEPEET